MNRGYLASPTVTDSESRRSSDGWDSWAGTGSRWAIDLNLLPPCHVAAAVQWCIVSSFRVGHHDGAARVEDKESLSRRLFQADIMTDSFALTRKLKVRCDSCECNSTNSKHCQTEFMLRKFGFQIRINGSGSVLQHTGRPHCIWPDAGTQSLSNLAPQQQNISGSCETLKVHVYH